MSHVSLVHRLQSVYFQMTSKSFIEALKLEGWHPTASHWVLLQYNNKCSLGPDSTHIAVLLTDTCHKASLVPPRYRREIRRLWGFRVSVKFVEGAGKVWKWTATNISHCVWPVEQLCIFRPTMHGIPVNLRLTSLATINRLFWFQSVAFCPSLGCM